MLKTFMRAEFRVQRERESAWLGFSLARERKGERGEKDGRTWRRGSKNCFFLKN